MVTLGRDKIAKPVVAVEPNRDGFDAFACEPEQEFRRAGLPFERSWAFRAGAPGVALVMLVVTVLVALAVPDPGRFVTPIGVLLTAVAAGPWARWLLHGDDGPTWVFVGITMSPIAALGVGQWFVPEIGLGSNLAYPILSFQSLLVIVLVVGYAPDRKPLTMSAAAVAAFGGPLLAALATGQRVDGVLVIMWCISLLLAVVAGYAVRLSHGANRAVAEAREAMARQEAADERRRMARDVHDVVAHTLAVTMLHITAARMAIQRSANDDAREALEEAERHGRASLGDIRRVVRLLRSGDSGAPGLAQPGLADIAPLVEGFRAAGFPVHLSVEIDHQDLSPATELAFYRVLQEALANAARHGAGPATVELSATPAETVLSVGNPVSRPAPRRPPGSGLLGMQERIGAAGGTVSAGVEHDRWVVRATAPRSAAS